QPSLAPITTGIFGSKPKVKATSFFIPRSTSVVGTKLGSLFSEISRISKASLSQDKVCILNKPVALAREKSRSEEHTSELQSRFDLVCRLLLEKKNKTRRERL